MKRVTVSFRIAICLTLMSLSAVLLAHLLGLFPDERRIRLETRVALCESLAINCSVLATRSDIRGIEGNLKAFLFRNDDVLAVSLRQAGKMRIHVGQPVAQRQDGDSMRSTDTHIFVPITSGDVEWATIEVWFRELRAAGWIGWFSSPLARFIAFVTAFNAIAYIYWLRRVLTHLDPARVMPQRVRSALDTLAEGLLVLDDDGRIVMANKAFAGTVGQEAMDLQGMHASELPWVADKDDEMPWDESLNESMKRLGVPLKLGSDGPERSFMVNASPIVGDDGKSRGVLASFDDITDLENKKDELLQILTALRDSREEIRQQNTELKRLATIDPLTECLNRRSFFQLFDSAWKDARDGGELSCIMVDIDHFKSINDDHGHSKGDEVLRGIAATLRDGMGERGVVCRFGGEEFCILLPKTGLDVAEAHAGRLLAAIRTLEFDSLKVTASLGVSASTLGAADPHALLDEADKCLYVAKRNGRNQVVRWDHAPQDIEVDESQVSRTKTPTESNPQASIPFHAVTSLVSALSYRDPKTASHSGRVADLCVAIARGLMSVSDSYVLEVAALLHDIGKIGVPDAILLKPGELTDEEWEVMKRHERVGVEIVSAAFDSPTLIEMIRLRHATYSRQSAVNLPYGEEIPLGARILSLADAYDSMVTDRVYRPALPQQVAFAELRRCAGKQFDPQLTERLIEVVEGSPDLAPPTAVGLSKQTALQLGEQVEQLARAVDEQDLAAIESLVSRLQSMAARAGASEVEERAQRLQDNLAEGDAAAGLFEMTMELIDLCRSAQRSAIVQPVPPEGDQV